MYANDWSLRCQWWLSSMCKAHLLCHLTALRSAQSHTHSQSFVLPHHNLACPFMGQLQRCAVVWKRKLNGMTLHPATAATSAALSCFQRLSGLLMKLSFWNGPDYYKLKTSFTIYVGQWAWSQAAACFIFCLLTQGHRPQESSHWLQGI